MWLKSIPKAKKWRKRKIETVDFNFWWGKKQRRKYRMKWIWTNCAMYRFKYDTLCPYVSCIMYHVHLQFSCLVLFSLLCFVKFVARFVERHQFGQRHDTLPIRIWHRDSAIKNRYVKKENKSFIITMLALTISQPIFHSFSHDANDEQCDWQTNHTKNCEKRK